MPLFLYVQLRIAAICWQSIVISTANVLSAISFLSVMSQHMNLLLYTYTT